MLEPKCFVCQSIKSAQDGKNKDIAQACSRDVDSNFELAVHLHRNFDHQTELRSLFMACLEA